jgi:hypothetical protein
MFSCKIIIVQSDRGGEYEHPNSFFLAIGITNHISCPHTHQHNGAVECKHRHIIEMSLAPHVNAFMPLKFWDQAFLAPTHHIIRTPTKLVHYNTPLHHLLGATPGDSMLHVFGCTYWPNLRPYNVRKLQYRSTRCVFFCYSTLHKGYKCLNVSTGQVYISRDVIFDENVFPFANIYSIAGTRYSAEILLLPDSKSSGLIQIYV